MAEKRIATRKLLLVLLVLEIMLVLVSGGLNRALQIGFENGRFYLRNVEKTYDLQKKITEDFQPDRYLQEEDELPEIYGSERLYNFFREVFGEKNALSSFQLLRMLFIVNCILISISLLVRRHLFKKPSKPQVLFELLYKFFEDFVKDTLGEERVNFTPYVVTLFIFIWTCNMIGIVPIPGFIEPTRNLNVPLGLGIMAVSLVHILGIRIKGFWKWFKGFFEPLPFLAPLNMVGELSKAVSISFRLFGNILGGAIIMLVVSSLVKFVVLPIGLNLFFGIFVGTIQSFVFTMLALTYIGAEITE
ncbi:MAG: F0F1 ATP synthase subunit A [Candidatus Cloacimonetes bacterium]|nr:F0F1 ATP synthase subunit A [Candidatus Cloacimonadota bacterium]